MQPYITSLYDLFVYKRDQICSFLPSRHFLYQPSNFVPIELFPCFAGCLINCQDYISLPVSQLAIAPAYSHNNFNGNFLVYNDYCPNLHFVTSSIMRAASWFAQVLHDSAFRQYVLSFSSWVITQLIFFGSSMISMVIKLGIVF